MKRFVRASLIVALAISSIPAVSTALPRFYRETIYYEYLYEASPGHSPSTGERVEVGWDRYYCDGTVRSFGQRSGYSEDSVFGTCD